VAKKGQLKGGGKKSSGMGTEVGVGAFDPITLGGGEHSRKRGGTADHKTLEVNYRDSKKGG